MHNPQDLHNSASIFTIMDGQTFAERFLEEYGVATVPGVEFGELGRNHIRISYATSLAIYPIRKPHME